MHWTCAAAFLRRFSWTNATSSPWMHPRQEITSCSWPSTDQVDNAIIWLFDTWEGTFTTSPLCCRRVEITQLLSSGAKSPFQVLRFNVWRERFLSNEHSLAYRIIIVNKYSDLPPFPLWNSAKSWDGSRAPLNHHYGPFTKCILPEVN